MRYHRLSSTIIHFERVQIPHDSFSRLILKHFSRVKPFQERFQNVPYVINHIQFPMLVSLCLVFCFKVESSVLSQLVMDVHECWKTGQKYEQSVQVQRKTDNHLFCFQNQRTKNMGSVKETCTNWSHGTKSAILDGKRMSVVDSNTKEFQPVKLDFPLISMSQWRMPCFFAIQHGGFCTM